MTSIWVHSSKMCIRDRAMTDESAKAVSFHDDVLPKMDALRAAADDLSLIHI